MICSLDRAPLPTTSTAPRVLLVAEHCSLRYGGEGAIAYHYFRVLRARDVEVLLLTHARCRDELQAAFPRDQRRMRFVEDHWLHRLLHQLGRLLPDRVSRATTGFLSLMFSQFLQRRIIRQLAAENQIDVVHQPTPVSPAQPSLICEVGVPVVMGPFNGGIDYPAGFRERENGWERRTAQFGRRVRHLANRIFAGKRKARLILVANERTRQMLPGGLQGRVAELVENGVDLALWQRPPARHRDRQAPVRFAYLGRLVDCKGVDLLLEAWSRVHGEVPIRLEILGDGPLRAKLEAQCDRLGLAASVKFLGWLDQPRCWERLCQADALILPSLLECGGACLLEAMATELAVVATAWGGPTDYIDPSCGFLIEPSSREPFVNDLAGVMRRLGSDPQLCAKLGAAGRAKVEQHFDWERKVDVMLEHYAAVIADRSAGSTRPHASRKEAAR